MKTENQRIRPSSSNQIQQKQEQDNQQQKEQYLKSIKHLQNLIEDLKQGQETVSESLRNNLTYINNKMDVIESLINDIYFHPLSSDSKNEYPKPINKIYNKTSNQRQIFLRPTQNEHRIMSDQVITNQEINLQLNKVQSAQILQSEKKQINIQSMGKLLSQFQSSHQSLSNQQEKNTQQNQIFQELNLKFKQCHFCKKNSLNLIETPCHHVFHLKCLKQLYDEQIIEYEKKKKFTCICQQELQSSFFMKNLQIDKDFLLIKQLQIIYQKYHNKFKICRQCNTFWIYDIFKKISDTCFQCEYRI